MDIDSRRHPPQSAPLSGVTPVRIIRNGESETNSAATASTEEELSHLAPEETMMEGDVTSVESPARFFCRTKEDKEQYLRFKERLKGYYYRYGAELQVEEAPTTEEDVVAWFEGTFWRARPATQTSSSAGAATHAVDGGGDGRLYHLVDNGRAVKLSLERIYLLAPEFSLSEHGSFVFRCHLSDVVASADGLPGAWGAEARAMLSSEVRRCDGLLVQRRGPRELMQDGYYSLPVELHFRETVAECFRVSLPVLVSMSAKLLKAGLAVTKLEAAREEEEEEEEQLESGGKEEGDADLDLLTIDSLVDSTRAKSDFGSASTMGEQQHTDEDLVSAWPPPHIPRAASFAARITHVSDLGQLFLQRMEDLPIVRTIRSELNKIHKGELDMAGDGGDPNGEEWQVGQECVALYYRDESWYRARVLGIVDAKHVAIVFVDYGNVTQVRKADLRPARDFGQHRMYALRIVLDGIEARNPDGRWSKDDLDTIHSHVFYMCCRSVKVTVKDRRAKSFPLSCDVHFRPEGKGDFVDLGEFLIREGLARRRTVDFDPLREEYLDDAFGIDGISPSSPNFDFSLESGEAGGEASPSPNSSLESLPLPELPFRPPEASGYSAYSVGDLVPVQVQVVMTSGFVYFHRLDPERDGDGGCSAAFSRFFTELAEEVKDQVSELYFELYLSNTIQ